MDRLAITALHNQFESSYQMLDNLIQVIPEDKWYSKYHDIPMWKQVFHILYFIEFWIRPEYNDREFRCMKFDERISPELDVHTEGDISISKEQMLEYLNNIHLKTLQVFEELQDKDLGEPIINGVDNYTYLDVITGQIRHIMYNIGYCNACLREHGLPESDWYSYNEKD
ncbi:DinB family protein [Mobilitalea sibirica]|uniref:DinB family protein n=1 Tax=Mobilitalea sibirica TaxID=1462919 RepID=A0A8J7H4A3_9FIRM|nr:DinB family protein [Mobilitalea sibirica]MBH1942105.1 DinB family protein [Mobilitalea sibirica]